MRRFEMTREHQPLVDLERMIVFAVITFEPVLTVDALLGADEAEVGIAQRNAVVGVPAAQHRARHFAGHTADRGAAPDPARRRIADPGLAVGLVHVFDRHAADPVREIMILRRRDRRRQMAEAEFFQAGQKALLLLAAKHPEHEFRGIGGPAPRHDGEDQAGEIGVIEIGDAAPSQPLRFLRSRRSASVIAIPKSCCCCKSIAAFCQFTRISWRAPRTSAGFPYCTGHMQGASMRNNILLAIVDRSAGASARRLQRASTPVAAEQTFGPSPTLPAPATFLDTDRRYRHRHRLARRRQAHRRRRNGRQCVRHRARPSAHALCLAQWRCAGGRDQCAAEARRWQGHQGLDHENGR